MTDTEAKPDPLHITQAYNLDSEEDSLDFFDANLYYDSPLFIDPFLFKTSPVQEEKELFGRFGVFFKNAYNYSLNAKDERGLGKLKSLLSFHEPKELNLGYTLTSNKGSGLGGDFASAIINFFMKNSAHRIIMKDEVYPQQKFNPDILAVITEGVGPDGLSDLAGCLMMDYFIKYTQEQCKKWNIPTKTLPVQQTFDFEEMTWTSGAYFELPENTARKGEAIVFVPKRLLRMAIDMEHQEKGKNKIIGILRRDEHLRERFSSLISRKLSEISIEDIQDAILAENSLVKIYLELVEQEGINSYDFKTDALNILAIKRFAETYKEKMGSLQIENCDELLKETQELVDEFNTELSKRDGWTEMWYKKGGKDEPKTEKSFGRLFRGMGHAYFRRFKSVTFMAEAGSGNGFVDFIVIFGDCRITIEVKKLSNSTPTGVPPLPAYKHGIVRQLPEYTVLQKAKYAFYITGQHYKQLYKGGIDHSSRVNEINAEIPAATNNIKKGFKEFQKLFYLNIDISPKASASKK